MREKRRREKELSSSRIQLNWIGIVQVRRSCEKENMKEERVSEE